MPEFSYYVRYFYVFLAYFSLNMIFQNYFYKVLVLKITFEFYQF